MEDLTRRILTNNIEEIFNSGGDRAYLLSELNSYGGINFHEIDYDSAILLSKGDIYLDYSINRDYPIKKQFVLTYRVVDKVIDKKDNIILIAIQENIDLQ